MKQSDRKIKAVVINHGHLDIEWYKTMDAYRFWALDIMDTLINEAIDKENYETYTFDGSVFLLDDLIKYFPKYEEKIRNLIKEGKLLIGPFYTQFDEWIPSAECMVRNCLWGNRRSLEYGAAPMKVGYLPDNFGHPRQLPQILNDFGIDSLLFMRGMVDIDKGREFYLNLNGYDLPELSMDNSQFEFPYWFNMMSFDDKSNSLIFIGFYAGPVDNLSEKDREILCSEVGLNIQTFFDEYFIWTENLSSPEMETGDTSSSPKG